MDTTKAVLLSVWLATLAGITCFHFAGVFDQVGWFYCGAGATTMLVATIVTEECFLWCEANQDRFPSWLVQLVGNQTELNR